MQPAVPLWLAGGLNGIPYDPASGQETLAILRAAMQALSMDDKPGFFYLTLHDDEDNVPVLAHADAYGAYKAMYRLIAACGPKAPVVRLLGAGRAARTVIEAANLLNADWNIAS